MALDHIRNHRWESDPNDSTGLAGQTVSEQHCKHCGQWVEVRGVLGGLAFMAKHDSGDCADQSAPVACTSGMEQITAKLNVRDLTSEQVVQELCKRGVDGEHAHYLSDVGDARDVLAQMVSNES